MADSGIKKITVQPTDTPVLSSDGKYYLRYRVVSEDKNSTSVWSPVYGVTPNAISTLLNLTPTSDYLNMVSNTYESDGAAIRLTWTVSSSLANAAFDIYAKWNNNASGGTDAHSSWDAISWTYLGTTTGNSFQYSIPSGYIFAYSGTTAIDKFVKFRVQVGMSQKTILNSATLFRTVAKSTKPTSTDGGSPNVS